MHRLQIIKPHLEEADIEYIGEIDDHGKNELLGKAFALLFPISWNEPLGTGAIESLACGAPVVAFCRGSMAEIIDDGQSGFIVESVEQAVQSLSHIARLKRKKCRQIFEERFTSSRMCREYLTVYDKLLTVG